MREQGEILNEYRELIGRVAIRHTLPYKANHKGKAEVARLLGIAYVTLKHRLNGTNVVKREHLLAARWLDANPVETRADPLAETTAAIPVIPMCDRDYIVFVIENAGRPVNVDEIRSGVFLHFNKPLDRKQISNRLYDELGEVDCRIKRSGRGVYVPMPSAP